VFVIVLPLRNDGARDVGCEERDSFSELRHEVGDCTDMVVVGMGNDNTPNVLLFREEIGDVRDDVINAGHILLGELEAHVNNNDVVLVFENGHIPPDLLNAANGDNPKDRAVMI
jgi:hypothetical protein